MPSENIAFNFEDRFSKININKPNLKLEEPPETKRCSQTKKKAYPNNLYPSSYSNVTTPSFPILSTAKRAETRETRNVGTRNVSATGSVPKTPHRINSNLRSLSTVKQAPEKRISSCPMSEKSTRTKTPSNYQFSFMKETSSSLQKKNSNPFNPKPNTASPDIIQTRISSLTKKRLDYSRHLNQSLRCRRIASSSTLPSSQPSDITNLNSNRVDKKLDFDRYLSSPTNSIDSDIESPTKVKSRHVSQPAMKDDVYNRLYNNSYKQQISFQQRMDQQQMKQQSQQLKKIRATTKSKLNEIPSKINNLFELYKILYKKDPNLFQNDASSDNFKSHQPLEPHEIINGKKSPNNSLNIYERGEILRKKDLYFISNKPNTNKSIDVRNFSDNFGFDDKNGNYIIVLHDHINFRYEIEEILGNGSFGNVVKCKDHKSVNSQNQNKTVAIKIIKNDLNWSLQAVYEIKMLKFLNENVNNKSTVLNYFDHFHFRGHMCIVTELLSLNLYSLLELVDFKGLSLDLLKMFSMKILNGLKFIHDNNMIHCDIKPENIMVKLPSDFNSFTPIEDQQLIIKIIDFGSSCFENEISYTYIQSRFYRSPEVIIGAKYDKKIDIWSFGCAITELYMGAPLLPGKNELEQIGLILELFGAPSSSLISNFRKRLLSSLRKTTNNLTFENPINQSQSKIDEKSIKKTLLYTLFDLNGKINLQFLNYRISNASNSGLKRQFKLSSRNLEFCLKLNKFETSQVKIKSFINFLNGIFKWDPTDRFNVDQLLNDNFLKN